MANFEMEILKVREDGMFRRPQQRTKKVKTPKSRIRVALERHKFYWEDERIYRAEPGADIDYFLKTEWIATWKQIEDKRENPDRIDYIYELVFRPGKATKENLYWIIEGYPLEDGHIYKTADDTIQLHRVFDKINKQMFTRKDWIKEFRIRDLRNTINALGYDDTRITRAIIERRYLI